MYYLANHGSLERSVNLVEQGFIQRHTHFRMRIVFSLYFNSFAYIGEKRWKLYVHPNWKQLSTLDSDPVFLGRLPPWGGAGAAVAEENGGKVSSNKYIVVTSQFRQVYRSNRSWGEWRTNFTRNGTSWPKWKRSGSHWRKLSKSKEEKSRMCQAGFTYSFIFLVSKLSGKYQ